MHLRRSSRVIGSRGQTRRCFSIAVHELGGRCRRLFPCTLLPLDAMNSVGSLRSSNPASRLGPCQRRRRREEKRLRKEQQANEKREAKELAAKEKTKVEEQQHEAKKGRGINLIRRW